MRRHAAPVTVLQCAPSADLTQSRKLVVLIVGALLYCVLLLAGSCNCFAEFVNSVQVAGMWPAFCVILMALLPKNQIVL